ncbi:hypothetical protein, partial [Escherichia coli]|uniref:hypothetical protein n=1 Tax=Escherichia coli TaxID=562 RepID=UPI003CE541FA
GALRKCNDRALRGEAGYGPAGPLCDDTDGRTQASIAAAEGRLRAGIAKRCGGEDRMVGGGDDFDPQDDLGYLPTCLGDAA